MRSSISNSKRAQGARSPVARVLFFFALSFVLMAVAGWRVNEDSSQAKAWQQAYDLQPVVGQEYAVNEVDSDHFDIYDILYYGLDGAIDQARGADILFLGNSRMLFALRDEAVENFSRSSGLKVFNLCFPANDGMMMAYDTLVRHQLKPALVVVNENYFFNRGISPYGVETLREGRWQAGMKVMEHGISWKARLWLHRWFPRLNLGQLYGSLPNITVQSLQNGCLVAETFSFGKPEIVLKDSGLEEEPSPEEIETARWFRDQLRKMGISMVLTNIPYDVDSYVQSREAASSFGALLKAPENAKPFARANRLAALLGVPLVAPVLADLKTIDGSHLTEKSAARFSEAFFKGLMRCPEVQNLSRKVLKPEPGEGVK